MSEIQFGTTVIDETLKRTFTLTNRGALGTKFDFFKVTGELRFLTHQVDSKDSDQTGRMPRLIRVVAGRTSQFVRQ